MSQRFLKCDTKSASDKNKWKLIKTKNFCAMNDTIKKVKRQTIELGEILTNRISGKGLVSRVYMYISRDSMIQR